MFRYVSVSICQAFASSLKPANNRHILKLKVFLNHLDMIIKSNMSKYIWRQLLQAEDSAHPDNFFTIKYFQFLSL